MRSVPTAGCFQSRHSSALTTHRPSLITALLAALAIILAAPTPAAAEGGVLTGHVLDGTNDERPLGNWPIDLHFFAGSELVATRPAETDASGTFRFTGLPTGPDRSYVVAATRADVLYTSDVMRFNPESPERDVALYTFEPVDNDGDIVVDSVNLAITDVDAGERLATVIEVQNVVNAGKHTYIGSRRPDGNVAGTIVMRVPSGTRDFQPGPGLLPESLVPTPRGFATLTPVQPGRLQITFGYRVPYDGTSLTFDKSLAYPTRAVRVLAPVALGPRVTGFEQQDDLSLGGQQYRLFVGANLAREATVTIQLATLPAPPLVRPPRPDEAARYAAVAAILAVLAVPFLYIRRRRRTAERVAASRADLWREREELLRTIAALDDEHAAGGLSDADYERRRSAHKARLVGIAARLETVERPAAVSTEAHSGH